MGTFKLGKMTFGSLFKKPETVLYPFESKPQPKGLKGHIDIDADKCIVCGLCDKSCSTDCIKVDRKARTWEINRFGCVQCGYCVTVCPKKCLSMAPDYWATATEITVDRVVIPEKPKQEKELKTAASSASARESALSGNGVNSSVDEQSASSRPAATPKSATPVKVGSSSGNENAASSAAVQGQPPAAENVLNEDEQLKALISHLSEDKAAKVKAALSLG